MRLKTLSNDVVEGERCGVIGRNFIIQPDEEIEINFAIGFADTLDEAIQNSYGINADNVQKMLEEVVEYWDNLLGKITIKTPDRALDIIINNWIPYQVFSARVYARAGFYQAGGAFGFRDQLQDMLGAMYFDPILARRTILEFAGHQFVKGDVQHWWHPPARGVRTKISDDKLFLPYVVSEYIAITEDIGILEEVAPYLADLEIEQGAEAVYDNTTISDYSENLYNHCNRAISSALNMGEHGLPLMGTGDWNDAMNSVGDEGKGESVWLGWFLYDVLVRFMEIANRRGDIETAERYSQEAERLRENLEQYAWDGSWYLRAYDDEGKALGASENTECRIDCISQAWAGISNAANNVRVRTALESAMKMLFNREDDLLMLLTPPFEGKEFEPGYIANYLPGVRENGGQYTHGAVWLVKALAEQNMNIEAWDVLRALNPINHSSSEALARKYKAEPYVLAADVYSQYPNNGRGGWTWYTGSASWLYKVVLDTLIGFKLRGSKIIFEPHLPPSFDGIELDYRWENNTVYKITVYNTGKGNSVKTIYLDGRQAEDIQLSDDGMVHKVKVILE
jgi:cellobiose phosphorylase